MLPSELHLEKFSCDYVDVRVEEKYRSHLLYRNFECQSGIEIQDVSIFIRVFNRGRWFFSSITEPGRTSSEIERLIDLSCRLSGSSARFSVPIPNKKKIIRCTDENAKLHTIREKKKLLESFFPVYQRESSLVDHSAIYADWWLKKDLRSSAGHSCSYDATMCGIHFVFTLKDGDDIFRSGFGRAYPAYGKLSRLQKIAARDLAEAKTFLHAETVKPGLYPVILSEEAAGVFAHESFGHKSEADFMLGDEKMMKEWKIGKRVGSQILSIVDKGHIWGNSGYCPVDDEGTMSEKTYLVRKGILCGRLHSLETAASLSEKPTGNARALNGQFEPIVRMTNTYIEAGESRFQQLLDTIKLGVYVKTFRHGTGFSTFTIAPEKAFMIREGGLAEPVRVSVVSGSVFQTLKDINGLSSRVRFFNSAVGGCGKMEQAPLPVSFGGPKVKVRKMRVG